MTIEPHSMRYFPVQLDVRHRDCLVVGGGGVGTRKVGGLLRSGARVTVVSPTVSGEIRQWVAQGRIQLHERAYRAQDLDDMFLVIGATDDEQLNRRIHADARSARVLCNIADRPERCDFILPAVVHRGDLVITVSTSGSSPAFAKHLRKELEKTFGPEYDSFLRLMAAIRSELLREAHAPEAHKPLFEQLIESGLLEMVRRKDTATITGLLTAVLGPNFSIDRITAVDPGRTTPD